MEGDKIVVIGNAKIRERIQNDTKAVTLIHPDVVIGREVTTREEAAVMAGVMINFGIKIGKVNNIRESGTYIGVPAKKMIDKALKDKDSKLNGGYWLRCRNEKFKAFLAVYNYNGRAA